jgi:hypothetical protein
MTVALNHYDYDAGFVGRTKDGRQFFLTTPFVPAEEVGSPTKRFWVPSFPAMMARAWRAS